MRYCFSLLLVSLCSSLLVTNYINLPYAVSVLLVMVTGECLPHPHLYPSAKTFPCIFSPCGSEKGELRKQHGGVELHIGVKPPQ